MNKLSLEDVEYIVRSMANTALANERYFCDLDAVAGDADFGVSLADGFRKVLEQWDALDHSAISPFLLKVSMIISGNVGGCSGPIWGTAFMRAGMVARGKESLMLTDVVAMLRSAMEGIVARGGASLGDKTLLDVLDPIAQTLEAHSQAEDQDVLVALRAASQAADQAVETATAWVAKRGRQAFTGDRSIGSKDPGMVAIATMLHAVVDGWEARHISSQ